MSGRLLAAGAAALAVGAAVARAERVGGNLAAHFAQDGRVRLVGWGECG